MVTLDLKALEDAGLTAWALHELGPAMTRAIHKLTDIQRDLLNNPTIPPELLEERTAMNRNLLQLLKQAAMAIQGSLEDLKSDSDASVPNLAILYPERLTSHQAQEFAAFVNQCAKLTAAIDIYADSQPEVDCLPVTMIERRQRYQL